MSDAGPSLRRLRRLLIANHAALWGSVAALGVFRLVLADDPAITRTMAVLATAGTVLLAASLLVRRRRFGAAAALIIVANWIAAIGATYVAAFIAPVGLFGLLVPVVLLFEFLSPRLLRAFIVMTVIATGLLAGIGESRRSAADYAYVDAWVYPALVTFFVVVVVEVVALGLWSQARRVTEQTAALEASRRRLASAADDARRHIERDLHDGAQQRLSTLSVHLSRVQRLVRTDPEEAQVALAQAHIDLVDAIRELRDLAHGIYPALLDQRGLGSAVTAAARRMTRPCTVRAVDLGRFEPHIENAVYFTCLEAMHNADKHSSASAIRVDLTSDGEALTFVVADDGHGFDQEAVGLGDQAARGRGLTGMADRVRAAGGTLHIDSAPGRGTRVTGRISLYPSQVR